MKIVGWTREMRGGSDKLFHLGAGRIISPENCVLTGNLNSKPMMTHNAQLKNNKKK